MAKASPYFSDDTFKFLRQLAKNNNRDWWLGHKDTYDAVTTLVKEHSGAYGMGVDYAYTMVHKAPQRTQTPHEALAPVAAPAAKAAQ